MYVLRINRLTLCAIITVLVSSTDALSPHQSFQHLLQVFSRASQLVLLFHLFRIQRSVLFREFHMLLFLFFWTGFSQRTVVELVLHGLILLDRLMDIVLPPRCGWVPVQVMSLHIQLVSMWVVLCYG